MRLYKIVFNSALLIIMLLVSAMLALFYASDRSLTFLARQFFNSEELAIIAIQGAALRLNGVSIENLEITAPGYEANIKDLSASYDLAGLYEGVFQHISLAELSVRINTKGTVQETAHNTNELDSLESMVSLVANQPFDELSIQRLKVFLPTEQINGSLKFASNPPLITGQFNAVSLPDLKISIDSTISSNEPLELSLKLTQLNETILDSQALVTIDQNSFTIVSESEIALQELLATAHSFDVFPSLNSPTENLQISTSFQIDNFLTAPTMQALDVVIINEAGSVQFLVENEGKPLALDALLPLQVKSSDITSQSFISLETEAIGITLSGQAAELEIDASLDISGVKLSCNLTYDCQIAALLDFKSSGIRAQDWALEGLSIAGVITGVVDEGIYSVQGSNSTIGVTGVTVDQTAMSLNSILTQWKINQPLTNSLNKQDFISLGTESVELIAIGEIAGIQFNSNINSGNLNLSCKQNFDCAVTTLLTATVSNLKSQDWNIEELNLTSALEANLSDGNYRLLGNDAQVNVRTATYGEATTSFDSSFTQWVISGADNELLTAETQFELNDWNLDYDRYQIENPRVSGSLRLSNNQLVTAIEGSLQSSLKINGQLNSNIATGAGSLAIEVPQLSVTQAQPLSSYILGIDSQFDIIGGELSATGKVDWNTNNQGTLLVSGPMSFKVENVSGTYEDYFFFGLTTDLAAEFNNPLGLKTSGIQTARIDTAELGLPIRDISWDYEFNSSLSTIAIYELTGSLLGGQVSVPEAKFKDFSSNTELTVVISELDLASVTALAEYPELQVRGLASGYLPISLENGVITMHQGLVSALNPGGSIRYTPVNPSTNASIKLVNDALSNYQFKTLDSELSYDEAGDLNMQVNLRGGNPDMPAGQQINVNLNIINNVPDMLESLRASRTIEDALERNLQRRK